MKVLSSILRGFVGTGAVLLLVGCADRHRSALDPAGIQAQRISQEWWFFLWTCVAVYVWVLIVLLLAILRRQKAHDNTRPEPPEPTRERRMQRTIIGAIGVTILI